MPEPPDDLRDAVPAAPLPVDELYPVVYAELRRMAHRQLRREREGHTLCTTALVHEAYLRLSRQRPGWADRGHFLAAAAQAMRRILVDHARRHLAARRGGGLRRVDLDSVTIAVEERAAALVALDDALGELAAIDARLGRVVECRFFSGLSEEETAEALRVTSRTVRRDWVKAKGWLLHALKE
ncbi:MAG TPA: ECF-type sigma factor [Longimicrobium sp.]|jgi:RNA polymerase sigma factor (TIGR02999 family)